MAPPRILVRLGVLRAVVYCGRLVPEVSYIFGLGALLTIIGACILAGCYLSRTVDQATASDVNNQRFVFDSGAVFDAILVNISTSLSFTDSATRFELSSSGGTASGTNRFGSCILNVTNSDYPINAGPQRNAVITLNPCTFNNTNKTLTVSNSGFTATSAPATAN